MLTIKCLLLLLLPTLCTAQFKKDSKIIAHAKDSGNILFNKIAIDLFDKGFSFEIKDTAMRVIATGPLTSNKYATSRKIRIRFTDSLVIFTAQIALDFDFLATGNAKTFSEVSYMGAKKSPMREVWEEIDALAKKYFGVVTYGK